MTGTAASTAAAREALVSALSHGEENGGMEEEEEWKKIAYEMAHEMLSPMMRRGEKNRELQGIFYFKPAPFWFLPVLHFAVLLRI